MSAGKEDRSPQAPSHPRACVGYSAWKACFPNLRNPHGDSVGARARPHAPTPYSRGNERAPSSLSIHRKSRASCPSLKTSISMLRSSSGWRGLSRRRGAGEAVRTEGPGWCKQRGRAKLRPARSWAGMTRLPPPTRETGPSQLSALECPPLDIFRWSSR